MFILHLHTWLDFHIRDLTFSFFHFFSFFFADIAPSDLFKWKMENMHEFNFVMLKESLVIYHVRSSPILKYLISNSLK